MHKQSLPNRWRALKDFKKHKECSAAGEESSKTGKSPVNNVECSKYLGCLIETAKEEVLFGISPEPGTKTNIIESIKKRMSCSV